MKIDRVAHWISTLQVFWKEWNFRSFVLASFVFQLILVIMGPFRKQTSNFLVIVSIWFSYLLADWVATQAVGLASRTFRDKNVDISESNLTAFWAQFLLLHIGGPDTITALALEDNELWLRTTLQLGVQVYATLGVLVKSVQRSSLWIPTVLMFLVGLVKYGERAISLFNGRLSNFEEESDVSRHLLEANEPDWGDDKRTIKELTNVEMARHAFYFFHRFKGLYTGQIIGGDEVGKLKRYLRRRTIDDMFRVLEIEFNFAYQVFYTKTMIVHKRIGKILRPVAILFEIGSLIFWHLSKKDGFHRIDIRITYALLVGAIAVDVLALVSTQLSNWNVSSLGRNPTVWSCLLNKLLSVGNRNWGEYKTKDDAPAFVRLGRALFRRWSESIPQFNLIRYCEDERPGMVQKVIEFFRIEDIVDKKQYVSRKWFSNDLRDGIFAGTYDMERIVEEGALEKLDWAEWFEVFCNTHKYLLRTYDYNKCFRYSLGESLIGWHIFTEICGRDLQLLHPNEDESIMANRELCKVISNYMMYLFVWQPDALLTSSGSNKRMFREVKDLIKKRPHLLEVDLEYPKEMKVPGLPKWEAILNNFKVLTGKNTEMKPDEIWKFMARLWVLMLCHTAKHCKTSFHAARLKEGGELLSFVWLFMAHYGMGEVIGHRIEWGDRHLIPDSCEDGHLP